MAKKNNPIGSDLDLKDLDLDLDLGDPFGGGNSIGKNNSPIKEMSTSFASGALRAFTRPEQIRRIASNAMPEGYGTAVGTAYEAYAAGSTLYHNAVQELRPAMPAFRKMAGSLVNRGDKVLPKKIKEWGKRFAERQDDNGPAAYDADGALIAQTQMEIFDQQRTDRAEDRAQAEVYHRVSDRRAASTARIMDAVRQNTERLVAYQDSVLARWQRKNLEIQLRSYFVQRDQLKLMVATEQRQGMQLAAIMKNTALPEYRKTDLTEAARSSFRDRLLNNYQQTAVDFVSNFAKNLTRNLGTSLNSAVGQLAMAVSMGQDGQDMIRQQIEMEGGNKGRFYARELGGAAVPLLTRLLARPISRKLEGVDGVRRTGSRLQYMFGNAPERLNAWAQTADDDTSITGGLLRMLKETMPRTGIDPTLGGSPLYDANQGAAWDKQSHRSLNEIIPGYLSRMLQEMTMIRTGDREGKATKRLVYNMDRGEFTSFGTASGDARKRILHPHLMNRGREEVEGFVSMLDRDKQLSDPTRESLKRQVMVDAVSGRYFQPQRYMDVNSDTSELSADARREIQQLFGDRFSMIDGKPDFEQLSKFDKRFRGLRSSIYDPKSAMGVYMATGGREYLQDMGMIERMGSNDRVNYSKFYDEMINSRPEDATPDLLGPMTEEQRRRTTPYFKPEAFSRPWERIKGRAGSLWRRGRDGAVGVGKRVQDEVRDAAELYRRDGSKAVFDMGRMRAGEYIDATTQKTVQKLEDIKGDVLDRTGKVVASAQEISEGWLSQHPQVQTRLDKLRQKVRQQGALLTQRLKPVTRRSRALSRLGLRNARNKAQQFKDIYDQQGTEKLIDAARLAAGEYTDTITNKVLKSTEEIRGEVKDRTGRVVLSARNLIDGLTTEDGEQPRWLDRARQKLRETNQRARGLLGRFDIRGLADNMRSQSRSRLNAGIDRVHDVFGTDPNMPLIDAAKLKAGEYRDKTTGKIIERLEDIRGPVEDRMGKIVVSAQDLVGGLRDRAGRRLRSLEGQIRTGVSQLRDRVAGFRAGASNGATAGAEAGSVTLDENGQLLTLNARQVELLEMIYEVLESGDFGGGGPGDGTRRPRGGMLRRGIGGLGRGLGWAAKKYGRFAMAVWKSPFTAARGLFNTARSAVGLGQDYMGDISVAGGRVALTYVKMRNGDYFSVKSGKQIRKYRDIDGAVEDRSSEPVRQVLTAEEYAQGLYDTRGRRLFRATANLLGGVLGGLGRAAGIVGRGYLGFVTAPFQAMRWVANRMRDANAPQDVYVKGDPNPRVRVVDMNAGIVFDSDGRTQVRRFADIRGAVKMLKDGQVVEVISLDEFKAGLVDYRGRPLRRGGGLLGGALTGAAGMAVGFVRGYAKLIGGIYGLGRDMLVGGMRKMGLMFNPKNMSETQASIVLLSQIRDILFDRLPSTKKIRTGSWEEQLLKARADKEKGKDAKAAEERESKGPMSRLFDFLKGKAAGLFGLGGGSDEEEGEDDDGNTIIAGGAAGDGKGRRKKGWRDRLSTRWKSGKRAMGRSRIGRLLGGLGGKAGGLLGRFKPRGVGMGGIAAGVAGGLGLNWLINKMGGEKSTAGRAANTAFDVGSQGLTAYSLASMAGLTGGGAGAGAAAGAGGAAAGSAAAGGAGLLGGGAAVTIGLPIAVGAGIAAGVGYVGFKAWKKYRYGTYEPLRAFRLAQYGVSYSNTDQAKKVVELEQMLEPQAAQMSYGLDITAQNFKPDDIYKLFGLDDGWFSDNSAERDKFNIWFNHRFKPVYLTWLTNLRSIKPNVLLNDAESELTAEQKRTLLKAGNSVTPAAYTVTSGPFDGQPLEMTLSAIQDQYKLALNGVDKQKSGWGKFRAQTDRLNQAAMGLPFGIFGGDWITTWMEKRRQAKELDEVNAKQAGVADKIRNEMGKTGSPKPTTAQDKTSPISTPPLGMAGAGMAGAMAGSPLMQKAAQAGYQAGAAAAGAGPFVPPASDRDHKPVKMSGDAKEREKMLIQEAVKAGITDKTELAMFLAQMATESGNFKHTEENLNYKPAQMVKVWPRRFPTLAAAQAVRSQGIPAFADSVYGGRMGNDQPGDGYKYRGRGFIQLTGKANYRAFTKATGIDILSNPDMVARDPRIAARTAIHWWMTRGGGLRKYAAAGNVRGVTKLVNGGDTGLEHRDQNFRRYMADMAGERMNNLMENAKTAAGEPGSAPMAPPAGAGLPVGAKPAPSAPGALPAPLPMGGLPVGGGYADMLNKAASDRVRVDGQGAAGGSAQSRLPDAVLPPVSPGTVPGQAGKGPAAAQEAAAQRQAAAQQAAAMAEARSRQAAATDQAGLAQLSATSAELLKVNQSMDGKLGEMVTHMRDISANMARRETSSQRTEPNGMANARDIAERLRAMRNRAGNDVPADVPVPMRRNQRANA